MPANENICLKNKKVRKENFIRYRNEFKQNNKTLIGKELPNGKKSKHKNIKVNQKKNQGTVNDKKIGKKK